MIPIKDNYKWYMCKPECVPENLIHKILLELVKSMPERI